MRKENWYDIMDWEGYYQISDNLRFRSLDRKIIGSRKSIRIEKGKLMTIQFKNRKYPTISFSREGEQHSYCVHKLIGLSFIPNPENKPQLNHKNGKKHDYSISNLEWCTGSENVIHAYRTGLTNKKTGVDNGTYSGRNGRAKLVLDTETGIFYDCGRDVCRSFGWEKSILSRKILKGESRFIYV